MDDRALTHFYLKLTPTQRDVLQLVCAGLTNRQVSDSLCVEPCTVASHLTTIYEELGTLDAYAQSRPNRFVLISAFAGFFDRHPVLRTIQRPPALTRVVPHISYP